MAKKNWYEEVMDQEDNPETEDDDEESPFEEDGEETEDDDEDEDSDSDEDEDESEEEDDNDDEDFPFDSDDADEDEMDAAIKSSSKKTVAQTLKESQAAPPKRKRGRPRTKQPEPNIQPARKKPGPKRGSKQTKTADDVQRVIDSGKEVTERSFRKDVEQPNVQGTAQGAQEILRGLKAYSNTISRDTVARFTQGAEFQEVLQCVRYIAKRLKAVK